MMTRLLTTLACLALLPGAALAKPHHHARAHHKTAHHKPARHHRAAAETNGLHVAGYVHPPSSTGGDQGGSGDQPTPPPAPEQHPAPPPVAVIDSYDPGTRTLAVHRLNNDEKPTGHVADGVSVSCVYVKDGKLVNATPCDTDVLT